MTPTIAQMIHRYNQLDALKRRVETELAALDAGLRVAGVLPPRRGRPPIPQTIPEPELRELHRRYNAGDRTPEVVDGERQYKRLNKRRQRLARQQ